MMKTNKWMLGLAAALVMGGAINASQSFAFTECWQQCVTWGQTFDLNWCAEGSSTATGRYMSGTDGNGNKSLASQLMSASIAANQKARVRATGTTSGGSEIAGCATAWDYTVNGTSTTDTTDCNSAAEVRGYVRISLNTWVD